MCITEKIVKQIQLSAHFKTIKQEIETPSVVVYDTPEVDALHRNVYIESGQLEKFEITQSSNDVCAAIDFASFSPPPNCLIPPRINLQFSREVRMTGWYFYGKPPMGISLEAFDIGVMYI